MTTHLRLLAAAAALLLFASLPAAADLFGRDGDRTAAGAAPSDPPPTETTFTADALAAALPRSWRGTFAWDDGVAFYVEMNVVSVTVRADGTVAFNAETRWMPDGLAARISGRIDPATRAVRIWEIADDASADDFESDGHYDGTLAIDLWDLRARWLTTGSEAAGDLVLIAAEAPRPRE